MTEIPSRSSRSVNYDDYLVPLPTSKGKEDKDNVYDSIDESNLSIKVTGISSKVDENYITAFFEAKSGTWDDADVMFDPTFGLAIITFHQPGGIF